MTDSRRCQVGITALLICPAAILGTLLRAGCASFLQWAHPEATFPDILANILGCFFLGFITTVKAQFPAANPAIITALTTGFCGSLTTFSSWAAYAVEKLVPDARCGVGNCSALSKAYIFMSIWFLGTCSAVGSMRLGAHLGQGLKRCWANGRWAPSPSNAVESEDTRPVCAPANPSVANENIRGFSILSGDVDAAAARNCSSGIIAGEKASIAVILSAPMASEEANASSTAAESHLRTIQKTEAHHSGSHSVMKSTFRHCATQRGLFICGAILTAALLITSAILGTASVSGRYTFWLPAALGPLGALLRWQLATKLNIVNPHFPWGTFIANFFATGLAGAIAGLQYRKDEPSELLLDLSLALKVGICGTLSTASTWIAELLSSSVSAAYVYGAISLMCASALAALGYTLARYA